MNKCIAFQVDVSMYVPDRVLKMAAGVPNPPIYLYIFSDHTFIGDQAQGYSQW